MQQLKPVDVVIAGGGFVALTLAKEITARTSTQRGGSRTRPAAQDRRLCRHNG